MARLIDCPSCGALRHASRTRCPHCDATPFTRRDTRAALLALAVTSAGGPTACSSPATVEQDAGIEQDASVDQDGSIVTDASVDQDASVEEDGGCGCTPIEWGPARMVTCSYEADGGLGPQNCEPCTSDENGEVCLDGGLVSPDAGSTIGDGGDDGGQADG